MAPKGSSVIQAMLKRLAEEVQQKQNEAKVSIDAAGRPKARAAAV
jgi:ABC-type phosphate transport system substrate-binding protein